MSEKPRTWTLEKPPGIFDAVAVLKPREMRVGQKIKVIELGPVLDLLEEAHNAILEHLKLVGGLAFPILQGRMEELGALLREHGRLK